MNQFFQNLTNSTEETANSLNPLAGLSQIGETLSMIMTGLLITAIVAVVCVVAFAILQIRSQMATVAIQKDLRAIRKLLERQTNAQAQSIAQPPAQPNIATEENGKLL